MKEVTVMKYAYQAMMLNEFNNLDLECMHAANPQDFCDPLGDFNSPQTLEYSLMAILIFWLVTYVISYFIMKS